MPTYKATDIARWCGGTWSCEPPAFEGFCFDTRKLQKGELFVALEGERADGQSYVREALGKGAAGAVVGEHFHGGDASAQPLLRVKDTRRALQDMARAYRASIESTFIGITGSVGKTSVKEMCANVLAAKGVTARTCGNWNNDLGLPLSILRMEGQESFGVFEMGINHQGEMDVLANILQPTCGVMTRIGPAHIENFSSTEAIAREKSQLFAALPADGLAVISNDDEWFDLVSAAAPCSVATVSTSKEADFTARKTSGGEWLIRDVAADDEARFVPPLPGPYIVENALLATAVGRRHGVAWEALIQALETYRPLPMRWEQTEVRGVRFINDAYNANPTSVRAALKAFDEAGVSGKKWLVLGDMRELGATAVREHEQLGREVSLGSWAGLVVMGALGQHIMEGALAAGMQPSRLHAAGSHEQVAEILLHHVQEGDAVLLKASRGVALERVMNLYQEDERTSEPQGTKRV